MSTTSRPRGSFLVVALDNSFLFFLAWLGRGTASQECTDSEQWEQQRQRCPRGRWAQKRDQAGSNRPWSPTGRCVVIIKILQHNSVGQCTEHGRNHPASAVELDHLPKSDATTDSERLLIYWSPPKQCRVETKGGPSTRESKSFPGKNAKRSKSEQWFGRNVNVVVHARQDHVP
jgi:hypothetical protein